MENLEKILNNLPVAKFRRLASFKLRLRLYQLILAAYFKNIANSWQQALIWQRGLAVAILVMAVLGGTSVYAYNNEAVVPGNPIYPLKIAVENIEKAVAVSPTAKAVVYEKIASRRLQEAANLGQAQAQATTTVDSKISEDITASISAAINNHQAAVQALSNLDNKKSDNNKQEEETRSPVSAQAKVQAKNEERNSYLNQIEAYAESSQDLKVMQKVIEVHQIINQEKQQSEENNRPAENDGQNKNKKIEDNQENDFPPGQAKPQENRDWKLPVDILATSSTTVIAPPLKNILPVINSNQDNNQEEYNKRERGSGEMDNEH